MRTDEVLCSEFKDLVDRVIKSFSVGAIPFNVLHPWILNLERLIFEMDGSAVPQRLLEELSVEQKTKLNLAYCIWETDLEKRFVENNGATGRIEDYLLNSRFDRLIRKEIELLDGFRPKSILFIGSGPFPISAIHFHKKMNIPVHCLERNPTAFSVSLDAIRKLNLQNDVSVFLGEGESFAVSKYDLIIVALLAKPKNLILHNIFKHTLRDCRVICRTARGLRTVLYEPTIENNDTASFTIDAMQNADADDTISSFLLRKNINVKMEDQCNVNCANKRCPSPCMESQSIHCPDRKT